MDLVSERVNVNFKVLEKSRNQNMQFCTLVVIATVAGLLMNKTKLIHLRASFSEDACLLPPDHSFGFTPHVINQVVENCESLNTEKDPS